MSNLNSSTAASATSAATSRSAGRNLAARYTNHPVEQECVPRESSKIATLMICVITSQIGGPAVRGRVTELGWSDLQFLGRHIKDKLGQVRQVRQYMRDPGVAEFFYMINIDGRPKGLLMTIRQIGMSWKMDECSLLDYKGAHRN